MEKTTEKTASLKTKKIESGKDDIFEEIAKDLREKGITYEGMLKAGVHFGHQKSRWNPRMRNNIFTLKQGIHLIDLVKTKSGLEQAINFLKEKVARGEKILFVGSKRQAKDIVKKAAEYCEMPYVVERWLGGTLTNFSVIKKRIDKLLNLESMQEKGELSKYTKKEQLLFLKGIKKFNKIMGGIKNLKELPQAVFIIDAVHDKLAVKEARKMKIPIVSLVDTNADPTEIDFPIPANDDAVGSLRYLLFYVALEIGKNKIKQEEKK